MGSPFFNSLTRSAFICTSCRRRLQAAPQFSTSRSAKDASRAISSSASPVAPDDDEAATPALDHRTHAKPKLPPLVKLPRPPPIRWIMRPPAERPLVRRVAKDVQIKRVGSILSRSEPSQAWYKHNFAQAGIFVDDEAFFSDPGPPTPVPLAEHGAMDSVIDEFQNPSSEPATAADLESSRPPFQKPKSRFTKRIRSIEGEQLYRLATTVHEFSRPPRMHDSGEGLHGFNLWKRLFRRTRQILDETGPQPAMGLAATLLECESVGAISDAWQRHMQAHGQVPVRQNFYILSECLRACPDRVPLWLGTIFPHMMPKLPAYALEDCVDLLTRLSLGLAVDEREARAREIVELIYTIHGNSPSGYLQLRDDSIQMLIHGLQDLKDVNKLFRSLEQHKQELWPHTYLQFARRFADDNKLKGLATDIFESLATSADWADIINTPAAMSVVTSILAKAEGDSADFQPFQLTHRLLEVGMQPNLITWTVMIQNLSRAREIETAWDAFEMAESKGIEPNAQMLTVLMTGAKLRLDHALLERVVTRAVELSHYDPFLWNQLLEAIYISFKSTNTNLDPWFDEKRGGMPGLPLMLHAYIKLFRVQPLVKLCGNGLGSFLTDTKGVHNADSFLRAIIETVPDLSDDKKMDPSDITLVWMIRGYLREMTNLEDIMAFYERFRNLLEDGDPVARMLITGPEIETSIHDVCIMAMAKFGIPGQTAASNVLGDMLRSEINPQHEAAAPQNVQASERPWVHPAASLYSWNILLWELMWAGRTAAAERLLQTWQARSGGVKPDLSSWNIMIRGYAQRQDVKMTVESLRRLEAAGFSADHRTMAAFTRLNDKAKAIALMDRLLQHKAMRQNWPEESSELRAQLQPAEAKLGFRVHKVKV